MNQTKNLIFDFDIERVVQKTDENRRGIVDILSRKLRENILR